MGKSVLNDMMAVKPKIIDNPLSLSLCLWSAMPESDVSMQRMKTKRHDHNNNITLNKQIHHIK